MIVLVEHNTPDSGAKLLKNCTLPLTGTGVVHRVTTDLCVVDVTPSGLSWWIWWKREREEVERRAEARINDSRSAS